MLVSKSAVGEFFNVASPFFPNTNKVCEDQRTFFSMAQNAKKHRSLYVAQKKKERKEARKKNKTG